MMYDETQARNGQATDDTLAAFDKFHRTYLAPDAPGRDAYLTYNGRPMIFIFPKSTQTDWNRVRAETDQWDPAPLLIYEFRSTPYASVFDGFYAWVNPGRKGFAADGSNWGEDYLHGFYQTHAVEISGQDRRRSGLGRLRRQQGVLEPESPHRPALWPDFR